ncbi:hypothetical protein CkaCkLH20_04738 [Colletotrichum karsti]|uniref:Uncharacterized protein n=1 Tax=Colletotrichum karsti TaxID=1095194 RepID=A0A9P6LLC4_9PEZI|nr:uncharacterized protein CkaCkLH20_04738 [Colletotrichum karsti]KAF9877603.1 hypothetical protein CkaCkLH20_04738 [Colletotrichum karsti]
MSGRRWYFESSPDGREFVSLKRSRSHHYHSRHHYDRPSPPPHRCCRDDCCHLGRDEWNDLVGRERKLRETNECLARDNQTLKCNFEAAEAEARRLGGILPLLQAENQALRDDNAALRCSMENAGGNAGKYLREVERLRHRLHKMERDRDGFLARIKELSRHHISDRVEELRRIIVNWERKFDSVDDHNKRLRRDIDAQRCVIQQQEERLHTYERILRRHGFVRFE